MNPVTIALLQTMLTHQQIGIRLDRNDPRLKELQEAGLVVIVHEEQPYIWVKASDKALEDKDSWLAQKLLLK